MTSMERRRDIAPVTRTRTGRNGVQRLTLLIVDDHALLRQALRALIDGQENLEVVGEAANGRDAVEAAERLRPDVVLMDMVMPGLNGIESTPQIHLLKPSCRVRRRTAGRLCNFRVQVGHQVEPIIRKQYVFIERDREIILALPLPEWHPGIDTMPPDVQVALARGFEFPRHFNVDILR